MSVHAHEPATVANVLAGVAVALSWTDIRDDLSIACSVLALIVYSVTIWKMFNSDGD